ncbi:hypothetical protein EIP86_010446 [Pleurotus ostreatoroseus]|nr:hypothetical protein EIP86_010446 [Pleurotus ostreatoroseus]
MPAIASLPQTRECSKKTCKAKIPADDQFKMCEKCRESHRKAESARRARVRARRARDGSQTEHEDGSPEAALLEPPARSATTRDASSEDGDDDKRGTSANTCTMYTNIQGLMTAVREAFRSDTVAFYGGYVIPSDPLVNDRERTRMLAQEIWEVTGYRFKVQDHPLMRTGHKVRMWCSQDQAHKAAAKPSVRPGAKPRDTLGMHRYDCKSRLNIASKKVNAAGDRLVTVYIKHDHRGGHQPYYNVELPPEAAAIIRENVQYSTPNELVTQIQSLYPHVTSTQIHTAWSRMSETLWKRDPQQLPSAKLLIEEFPDDVDIFDIKPADGVEQLCWGMKRIAAELRGKVVEIGLDATFNTNSKHLELYSIMAEHDNAGYPLSYCLLSTASSMDVKKRTKALSAWAEVLRDTYHVFPKFIHLDKDMGEIAMSRHVWVNHPKSEMQKLIGEEPQWSTLENWIVKLQLCWWHLRRAVSQRLAKSKLSTTPYNASRAHNEFPFIDSTFVPPGQSDPTEYEGGDEEDVDTSQSTYVNPNSLLVRLPAPSTTSLPSSSEPVDNVPSPLVIRLPPLSQIPTDDSTTGRRTFCAEEFRQPIVDMMERHFCAHPLIPGYSHPSPAGIRHWAVQQMYSYCVKHDLREVWAYLWENWYRSGRWELWARSACPEIPRLKTTMMLESHWRKIKHDYLHHFHQPRIDLLVWIIITKLAPPYYQKLAVRLNDIGRFRELATWRKDFKADWKKCLCTPISLPLNDAYRPDPYKWHLVQAVKPVPPIFFLTVTRNRTAPFWSHSDLIPLLPAPETTVSDLPSTATCTALNSHGDVDSAPRGPSAEPAADPDAEDSDDDIIDTEPPEFVQEGETYLERMTKIIGTFRDFSDGLEYQLQFNDRRILDVVEREAAGALRLARTCLAKEKQAQSTRGAAPRTWDSASSSAMYYRARPARAEDQN